MLPGSSGISKYLEILLDSQFSQNELMRHDVFLRYLKGLGVNLTEEELEFYDKHQFEVYRNNQLRLDEMIKKLWTIADSPRTDNKEKIKAIVLIGQYYKGRDCSLLGMNQV